MRRAAPAVFIVCEHASKVAPVVQTSSSIITRFPPTKSEAACNVFTTLAQRSQKGHRRGCANGQRIRRYGLGVIAGTDSWRASIWRGERRHIPESLGARRTRLCVLWFTRSLTVLRV